MSGSLAFPSLTPTTTTITTTTAAAASQPWQCRSSSSLSTTATALYGYSNAAGGSGQPYDRRNNGRGGGSGGGETKSKRQERVGQLVQSELSRILHGGAIKGRDVEYLEDELRLRISVVSADVSPDLRQARVSVSVRPSQRHHSRRSRSSSNLNSPLAATATTVTAAAADEDAAASSASAPAVPPSPSVDRRRAYAWLVRNTKPIRHALAQRLSHMKTCPQLTFVQVDVSAAVDVMYLIDKVTQGSYKRDNVDLFDPDEVARGMVGGLDFDEDFDEDWDEDDGDFFQSQP